MTTEFFTLIAVVITFIITTAMWMFVLLWVLSQKEHRPLSETFSRKNKPAPEIIDNIDSIPPQDILDAIFRDQNPIINHEDDERPIE